MGVALVGFFFKPFRFSISFFFQILQNMFNAWLAVSISWLHIGLIGCGLFFNHSFNYSFVHFHDTRLGWSTKPYTNIHFLFF